MKSLGKYVSKKKLEGNIERTKLKNYEPVFTF
jgi:hypothetical protein